MKALNFQRDSHWSFDQLLQKIALKGSILKVPKVEMTLGFFPLNRNMSKYSI
jgi:hypothetical protein